MNRQDNKKTTSPSYQAFSEFLLRTPLMPLESVASIDEESLKKLIQDPVIEEALFLASPVLHSESHKWLKKEIKEPREERRIVYSLIRYFLRMSTRCTPFGLFAGCTTGSWGEVSAEQEVLLMPRHCYKTHTRLDMHYLCALSINLSNHELIKPHLKYFPNTSIYTIGKQIRYVEYGYVNKKRRHNLVAIDSSPYILRVLETAKEGERIQALAGVLVDDEISLEEAEAFIHELIANQLLVSELEPAITGREFLDQLLQGLAHIPGIEDLRGTLAQVRDDIQQLDEHGIGKNIQHYHSIAEKLKQLGTDYELNLLFQSDMVKPARNKILSKSICQAISTALEVLSKLTVAQGRTHLNLFKDAFYERYEDKEVPLTEALDTETGIGYLQNSIGSGDVSPLLDDMGIQYPGSAHSELQWNAIQSFLLRKYLEAYREGRYEVLLDEKELSPFTANQDDLPDTMASMIQLYKDKVYINSISGSSGANLLGRFCHADDSIYKLTREITQKEEELGKDVIFAEIVHLPESRTGNVLLHPVVRDYEIPFLAKAQVERGKQIDVNDLMISVRENRLYLRSKKHHAEVVPRLTNAHNFAYNSLPVYHFLCDMQSQNGRGGVYFNWGVLQNEFRFLPRVCYKNIIFSLAQWTFAKEDLSKLIESAEKETDSAIASWRGEHKIPRHIALVDGDNELVIDLDNELCVKTFLDTIRKRNSIRIAEFLFDPDSSVVRSPEGHFSNQIIVPLYKLPQENSAEGPDQRDSKDRSAAVSADRVRRTFIPGDEWLYYKFYLGVKTSDTVLSSLIKPLTEELLAAGHIDKWFFIRYNDPKPHIRIRFHSPDPLFYTVVIEKITALSRELIDQGIIWKVQTDTYQRELERYGPQSMELSETYFYHDSRMIVDMIDLIEGDHGEVYRWQFSLMAINSLFDDFNFSMDQREEIMRYLSDGFQKEFNLSNAGIAAIHQKYRKEKSSVCALLTQSPDPAQEWFPLAELIRNKSAKVQPLAQALKSMLTTSETDLSLNSLLGSYIHMLCNRLFKSRQRIHELVLYTFLHKFYQSERARSKSSTRDVNQPKKEAAMSL